MEEYIACKLTEWPCCSIAIDFIVMLLYHRYISVFYSSVFSIIISTSFGHEKSCHFGCAGRIQVRSPTVGSCWVGSSNMRIYVGLGSR